MFIFDRIKAKNNSRKYNGTTYIPTGDQQVQHFNLSDWPQRRGVYEVEFSKQELNSDVTFCKGFSKTVSGSFIKRFSLSLLQLFYFPFRRRNFQCISNDNWKHETFRSVSNWKQWNKQMNFENCLKIFTILNKVLKKISSFSL